MVISAPYSSRHPQDGDLDHKQFRAALKRLGWSHAELARRVDVHANTVSRWLAPGGQIPGPAIAYVALSIQILDWAAVLQAPRN